MSSWKRRTGPRASRRSFPISAFIGPNGGGKTLAAVWDCLPALDAGRPVLSTVRLLDYRNPRPCDDPACTAEDHETHAAAHPSWIPFTEWTQLLEAEHCDVIMDEVTGVASSRESHSMPSVVANALVQLRRRDLVLRWTAPSWSRADVIIRECSQAVTVCRGFLPVKVESGPDDVERAWRHRRLFRWLTYDAAEFDDWSAGKAESLKPWVRDFHWGPGSPAFSAYDTFDAVLSIGTVTDSGRCVACGGRRSAPTCSCPDYQRPSRRRSGTGGGSPLAGSAPSPASVEVAGVASRLVDVAALPRPHLGGVAAVADG